MQLVEHRSCSAGNPDASRYLRRADADCASVVFVPRGPYGHGGCVGSGGLPRAAQRHGPDVNTLGCSSAGHGRSGCTAGPGRRSARTGTSGLDGPCTPRTGRRCWTDASQRATLLWHRLHRHGVGCGAVFKLAGVRDRCRAHLLRHEHGCIAPWPIAGPALGSQHQAPRHRPLHGPRPFIALDGSAFACLAALRAARQASTPHAKKPLRSTPKPEAQPTLRQNRHLAAE